MSVRSRRHQSAQYRGANYDIGVNGQLTIAAEPRRLQLTVQNRHTAEITVTFGDATLLGDGPTFAVPAGGTLTEEVFTGRVRVNGGGVVVWMEVLA